MLFPTVEYALFFLIVLTAAWLLYRWETIHKVFLLVASYVFYGFWNWHYVPLLIAISAFSAAVAQRIQRCDSVAQRKAWLVGGVIVCLTTLVYYKYTAFFLTTALSLSPHVLHRGVKAPAWLSKATPMLPLGISFFVFHAISLMGDVYRNKLKQKVLMLDALLYVAFFPQLIAGPILKASSFMPQLEKRRNPRALRLNRAMMLIVSGLFKKVIISNLLATRLVEPVFAAPQMYSGADIALAIYGYAAQIYCDFSGYTSIAIGCALLLGYRFPRNFNAPYTASSPQDFWRRWHISLSSWLRNYLYIPLGGSRGGAARTCINLMITMLLGGLWHGAGWTFVIWGALHGFYLIAHRLWGGIEWQPILLLRQTKAWLWISRLLLFHAVCLGWIFFRSPSFAVAGTILHRLGAHGPLTLATTPVVLMLIAGLAGQFRPQRWLTALEAELGRWPAVVRGAAFAFAIFLVEVLGPTGVAPFIYFQF
jgi:D-alanyl-lipoteichoic acid acyltransferase DltB (MBOAT superfamily)